MYPKSNIWMAKFLTQAKSLTYSIVWNRNKNVQTCLNVNSSEYFLKFLPSPGQGLWTLQYSWLFGFIRSEHFASSKSTVSSSLFTFWHVIFLFWIPRPQLVEHWKRLSFALEGFAFLLVKHVRKNRTTLSTRCVRNKLGKNVEQWCYLSKWYSV